MTRISILTAFAPSDIDYLGSAYESILEQQGVDWEWVICEDGPTELARKFSLKDERIHWINTGKVSGPANARNYAATVSRGEILRNLDSDDRLGGPLVLRKTISVFDQNAGIHFMVGPMVDMDESGDTRVFDDQISSGVIERNRLYEGWLANNYFGLVHPTSLAFRRKAFFSVGGYPGLQASEDTAIIFSLNSDFDGWFADFPVTIHLKRTGSITGSAWYKGHSDEEIRRSFIQQMQAARFGDR